MTVLTTALILTLALSGDATSDTLSGKVVGIADGNTFTLLNEDRAKISIWLTEFDAAGSGQPYGNRSKQALSELIYGKRVEPCNWRRGLESGGDRPERCVIKGNINSKGEKIYHVPGMSSYGATRIDEATREHWFCSEEEARAAGWRVPRGR